MLPSPAGTHRAVTQPNGTEADGQVPGVLHFESSDTLLENRFVSTGKRSGPSEPARVGAAGGEDPMEAARPSTFVALVIWVVAAGLLLSLFSLWVGGYVGFSRAEPAAWEHMEPELPIGDEFQAAPLPIGRSITR